MTARGEWSSNLEKTPHIHMLLSRWGHHGCVLMLHLLAFFGCALQRTRSHHAGHTTARVFRTRKLMLRSRLRPNFAVAVMSQTFASTDVFRATPTAHNECRGCICTWHAQSSLQRTQVPFFAANANKREAKSPRFAIARDDTVIDAVHDRIRIIALSL